MSLSNHSKHPMNHAVLHDAWKQADSQALHTANETIKQSKTTLSGIIMRVIIGLLVIGVGVVLYLELHHSSLGFLHAQSLYVMDGLRVGGARHPSDGTGPNAGMAVTDTGVPPSVGASIIRRVMHSNAQIQLTPTNLPGTTTNNTGGLTYWQGSARIPISQHTSTDTPPFIWVTPVLHANTTSSQYLTHVTPSVSNITTSTFTINVDAWAATSVSSAQSSIAVTVCWLAVEGVPV